MKIPLLTLAFLGACARGPSPQDQADLVTVGAVIEAACVAAAVSPEHCAKAREAAVRLGVSLQQAEQARLMAEAWDAVRPVLTAGVSILVGLITGGGA